MMNKQQTTNYFNENVMIPQTSQSAHNSPKNFHQPVVGEMHTVSNGGRRRPSSAQLPLNKAQLAALNGSAMKSSLNKMGTSIKKSTSIINSGTPLPPIGKNSLTLKKNKSKV